MALHSSFERCCRLCAEEQDVTVMIFSEEAEAMILQKKLNKYLQIKIEENDKLPKNICIQCCTKLQTVCDFVDYVQKAQEILLNRSQTIVQEPNDDKSQPTVEIKPIKQEQTEARDSDEECEQNQMEVNVDPMIVLKNSELSPNPYDDSMMTDVTYLHSVDTENVTIKLIQRYDKPVEDESNANNKEVCKPFPCSICKRSFTTDLALKNHSWIHTKENTTNLKHQCEICKEYFSCKTDLMKHLKTHNTKGLCELCGRVFRSERTYNAHMAVHFTAKEIFTCKICGRSYGTWGNLKAHHISHSSERPYKCHLCKKSFKRNQDLKFHINQHNGLKPYKCPFCEKAFASSGNCYSHRSRMHPGRRVENKRSRISREKQAQSKTCVMNTTLTSVKGIFKYQCQLCNHSFMKRDNYIYHMYRHTGEKPFECSYCSEKFVTRRGLLIHHDKEHPTKDRPLALLSKNILLK